MFDPIGSEPIPAPPETPTHLRAPTDKTTPEQDAGRATMALLAERFSAVETSESDRDVTAAFGDFSTDAGIVFNTPVASRPLAVGRTGRRSGLTVIAEPECGTAFLARHIAAALVAHNIVSVSLLQSPTPALSRMLLILEDTVPDSFVAITKNGQESWARVPSGSALAILTPGAVYFEGREPVVFDPSLSRLDSRLSLVSTYG